MLLSVLTVSEYLSASAHMNSLINQGDIVTLTLQPGDRHKAKVAVMDSTVSERCQELVISDTLEFHRWHTGVVYDDTDNIAQVA